MEARFVFARKCRSAGPLFQLHSGFRAHDIICCGPRKLYNICRAHPVTREDPASRAEPASRTDRQWHPYRRRESHRDSPLILVMIVRKYRDSGAVRLRDVRAVGECRPRRRTLRSSGGARCSSLWRAGAIRPLGEAGAPRSDYVVGPEQFVLSVAGVTPSRRRRC